jgi:hypothetical protein
MATREKEQPQTRSANGAEPTANGSGGPPFMRVNKGLGAIAVYKPGRAIVLVLLGVVAVLAAGFGIGRATDPNDSSAPSADTVRAARASGFDAGFRTGLARGRAERPAPAAKPAKTPKPRPARKPAAAAPLTGAGALAVGVPYIVKVARDGGKTQVTRHVRMLPGATYWLCSDGNICTRGG